MDHPTAIDQEKGRQRLRLVLNSLHTLTRELWQGRNNYLHRSKADDALRLISVEDNEIKHYHLQPEMLGTGDRHYCERSLTDLLRALPANRR
jgi:hypothetical protein